MAEIEIVRGSLLDQDVQAIVNAANTSMRGGGGLDGQVHRRGGKGILDELMRVAPHGAKTSQVMVTGGHQLPFRYVLHVVGPVWQGGNAGEDEMLAACYRNAIFKAQELGVKSLGFASISTGIYRFPLERAAPLALRTAVEFGTDLDRILFALYGEEEFRIFSQSAK